MGKNSLFFILLVFFSANTCFAAQNLSTPAVGKVTEVNKQYNFVVVNLGEKDGLKPGSFLKVLRQGKEVGRLEVIKVRQTISAAEIREVKGKEQVMTDDEVMLLAEQKVKPEAKSRQKVKKVKKAKPVKERAEKEEAISANQFAQAVGANIKIEGNKNIVETEIKVSPALVFDATNILLRDRGFIVSIANREAGLLVASKGLILSRWEELWAGFTGAIDHELLFSIQIKEKLNFSNLEISISTGYLQKDRYQKGIIKDNSYVYREAVDLISEIRSWTEGISSAAYSSGKKTP